MSRHQQSSRDSPLRRRSVLARLRSKVTLLEMVDRLKEGIYITDTNGTILDANPAFLEMFGFDSLSDLENYTATDLIVDPDQREREMAILCEEGTVKEFELQLRRPDGDIRTVLDTAYATSDPVTGEMLFHGILVDITRQKELEDQLREQATRDPLTGCFNRRLLADLARDLNTGERSWGAAVIDIDQFKQYNDQLGHQAGDDALRQMARYLFGQVRSNDLVFRLGGDEFLLLLPDADPDHTDRIINRVTRNAEHGAPVPFSMGSAVSESGESLENTIGRADQNLISVRVQSRKFQLRAGDPGDTNGGDA